MSSNESKIKSIQSHFAPLIGTRILRYQTAEFLHDDGTWSEWRDLPIRIFTDGPMLVSVSWLRFDDLWLSNDESLPFNTEGAEVRWVENEIHEINACLGSTIRNIMLGRGQMAAGGEEIEIWTRLLIGLDDGSLEVFNALDENGYRFHSTMPSGEIVACL